MRVVVVVERGRDVAALWAGCLHKNQENTVSASEND